MKNVKQFYPLVPALGALIFLVLACNGGGKPAPSAYLGEWIDADGTSIYMNSDGKSGYYIPHKGPRKSRLPGQKEDPNLGELIRDGEAVVDNDAKTLTISLMGMGRTWKIITEPKDGEMTLANIAEPDDPSKNLVFRKR